MYLAEIRPELQSSEQQPSASISASAPAPAPLPWYAIRTRSNQERVVANILEGKGLEPYLPAYTSTRRWCDRTVIAQRPYFPGYVFCRFDLAHRLPVITTPGVVAIIGFGSEPTPIPDEQIASVRSVLESGLDNETCPFLKEGQSIKVVHGPLKGVQGVLVQKKAGWKLVVSIDLLQRSISVEVDTTAVRTL